MENKLKKQLSSINVWAIAFGCIIGWGAFVNPGKRFLPNSGVAGTAIAFLLGALIMIIISFSYAFMIKKCPKSGGEFTFAKTYLGKIPAFICGWFLVAGYLSNVPMNSTAIGLISEGLFGDILKWGFSYSVAGFKIYLGEILISCLILFLFAFLNIKGVKKAGLIQTILAVLLISSIFSLFIASFFCKEVSIDNLNPIWGFKYLEGKVVPNSNVAVSILSTFAIAPWAFVGFDTIPQAAEEVKFSYKKVIFIMVIAILFGAFVYISNNTLSAIVLKNWPEECASRKWVLLIAAEKMLGTFGKVLIGIAVISAVLSGIMGFYFASSRLMYSMSNEGYLPKEFGKINKHGVPSNAIIFCLIISLVGPFLGREALGWFVDMSSVGATIGFLVTCLACFMIIKKNNDKQNLFLKILSLIGVIFSFVFIILQLIPIPGLSGVSFTWQSYILLGVWIFFGIIFFMKQKKTFINNTYPQTLNTTSTDPKDLKNNSSNNEIVIIMAAGLGTRMLPITLKTPKPLVKINGIPMIETIIDSFIKARNIKDFYVVVGYKSSKFKYLESKYPNLHLIENAKYEKENNISSIYAVKDILNGTCNCFICEGDLVISDHKVFEKDLNKSCYFGKYIEGKSDDWVFYADKNNRIIKVCKGGEDKYNMCGISYFISKDTLILSNCIRKEYEQNDNSKQMFWDEVVDKNLEILDLNILPIEKGQIVELDSVEELESFIHK